MSDVKDEIIGVFMYDWQLEHIQHALAYFAGNAYMSAEKLEEIDDLIVQLEEGKMTDLKEDEVVAYYVDEGDEDDDGTLH